MFGRRKWSGNVRVIVYKDGQIIDTQELHNKIPDVSLNAARDLLKGPVNLQIKYLAWGNDDTPESSDDMTLGAEFGRKQITDQSDGGVGEITTRTYMAPNEGNEKTIEELGWFGGDNATEDPDTGILVARVLYHRAKTNLESLQVQRTDSFEEVI